MHARQNSARDWPRFCCGGSSRHLLIGAACPGALDPVPTVCLPACTAAVCARVQVFVSQGDEVEEGEALVVVEAMKMEHTVRAPCAGTVQELHSFADAQIQEGHVLAVVVPAHAAAAIA